MFKVHHRGDFKKTYKYLDDAKKLTAIDILHRYGRVGVDLLAKNTPLDSGATASAWGYKIEARDANYRIIFENTNVNQGVNVAILIQYGHATGTGGYVQGRDYINPALQPVFEALADAIGKEVASL